MRLPTRKNIESHAAGVYEYEPWHGRIGSYHRRNYDYPTQHVIGQSRVVARCVDDRIGEEKYAFAQVDVGNETHFLRKRPHQPLPRGHYEYDTSFHGAVALPRRQKIENGVMMAAMPLVAALAPGYQDGALGENVGGLITGAVVASASAAGNVWVHRSEIERQLCALDSKFEHRLGHIVLPKSAGTLYLQGEAISDVLDKELHVTEGEIEVDTTYAKVLKQVRLGDALFMSQDQSLWRDYIDSFQMGGKGGTDYFLQVREDLAGERGLKLELTNKNMPFAYNEKLKKDGINSNDWHDWRDATYSTIDIEPARLVLELLERSTNPDELWYYIEPRLVHLAFEIECSDEWTKRLKYDDEVDDLTKATRATPDELRALIHHSQLEQLRLCLEMVAIRLHLDEAGKTAASVDSNNPPLGGLKTTGQLW